MRPYRRRIYITKKDFQRNFILRFVTASAGAGLVAVIVFNVLAWRKLEHLLYTLHFSAESTGSIILPELVATGAVMAVLIAGFLFFTVRRLIVNISGPLFRIKKDVMKMAEGDLSFEIILRTGDRFADVADAINRMADGLRNRWKAVGVGIENAGQALQQVERYQDREGKAREAAEKLADLGRKIGKELEAFRTK